MAEKTLVIVIDALGYDLLNKASLTSQLRSRAIKLVPSWGFGESAVMWSGQPPQVTDRWNAFRLDQKGSPFRWTRHLPLSVFDLFRNSSFPLRLIEAVARKGVECLTMRRVRGTSPVTYHLPLAKLHFFSPVHDYEVYRHNSLNGHLTLFGLLRQKGVKCNYIGYPDIKTDREVFRRSLQAIQESEVTICFFFELDSIEHWQGKQSPEVSKKVDDLTEWINKLTFLFKQQYPHGHIIIFSDHGMIDVREVLDVQSYLKGTGLKDGVDYLSFYDSTMVRFWFFSESSKKTIVDKLSRIEKGRILRKDELKEGGLDFSGSYFGELIFSADPGTIISPNYFQNKNLFQAVHGYCPPSPQEYGFFIADKDMVLGDELRMESLFDIFLKIINVTFPKEDY
ncbi:MAG: alkaline phosphatase family protein [Deltaproteobacteria bacterium]|nr:alkaline phosphatase family protein [Deltaproteobacteria bacterium]